MRNIKIAALQFSCCSQVQENIDKAETMVREAASNGANLILLPELFERPYFCQEKRYDYYDYALPLTENPAIRRFQAPGHTMTTIALIDDHLIVRSGFAQLLGLEADFQVVAEFGSGREALTGLPGRGVQVCICDISMPDISGLELLSQLPKGMATIMLSVHDSPALIEQALNAGARGFLSKRCSPDELIAAVRTVAAGGCYLTPDIAMKLAAGRQDPLTKRERQVAEKLAQGMAVKEIAAELGLSPKTVHVHRANLLEKLGVSNDVELARRMFDSWQ